MGLADMSHSLMSRQDSLSNIKIALMSMFRHLDPKLTRNVLHLSYRRMTQRKKYSDMWNMLCHLPHCWRSTTVKNKKEEKKLSGLYLKGHALKNGSDHHSAFSVCSKQDVPYTAKKSTGHKANRKIICFKSSNKLPVSLD